MKTIIKDISTFVTNSIRLIIPIFDDGIPFDLTQYRIKFVSAGHEWDVQISTNNTILIDIPRDFFNTAGVFPYYITIEKSDQLFTVVVGKIIIMPTPPLESP
ncbi:MAG: hypothetical protein Q8M98_05190 [Candidatus Cloacimonadaceae bacterium]|nr:hypothetical protein [Candidatus Cloacimonadaceae bacterium]